jgi:hypothetical protein
MGHSFPAEGRKELPDYAQSWQVVNTTNHALEMDFAVDSQTNSA